MADVGSNFIPRPSIPTMSCWRDFMSMIGLKRIELFSAVILGAELTFLVFQEPRSCFGGSTFTLPLGTPLQEMKAKVERLASRVNVALCM